MKKTLLGMTMAALLTVMTMPSAQAEEMEFSGDIAVVSQYIWRGAPQTVDKVAVQGDIGVALGGLSASIWASNTFGATDPAFPGRDAIEFDWTVDYSGSFDAFGYSVGAIYYQYLRASDADFLEIYAGISYDAPISPSVTVYYTVVDSDLPLNNLNAAGDIWIDFGVSTQYEGFDLSATLSYVSYDGDPSRAADIAAGQFEDGLSLITLGVSKDFKVSDLTVTPSLTIYIPIASDALDGQKYIYNTQAQNDFVFGVNIAF